MYTDFNLKQIKRNFDLKNSYIGISKLQIRRLQ